MKSFLQIMAFANKYAPYMGILQSVLDARGAFRASVQGHKKVVICVDDGASNGEILANVQLQLDAGIIDRF